MEGPLEEAAYASHADGVKATLSVDENLRFWADVHGQKLDEAVFAAFDLIRLRDRAGGTLSAGQKRRLGLARLAVIGRRLLLLDEPTVSLDTASVALFAAWLKGVASGSAAAWPSSPPTSTWALMPQTLDLIRVPRRARGGGRVRRGLPVRALLIRDLRLAIRAGGGFGLGLAFFLIVIVLVPFGVGPEASVLRRIAPGILWVAALLAALLSLDRIFALDHEDGSLPLLATSPLPLEGVALAKAAAHWITTGLPLTLAAPALGFLLNLAAPAYGWLLLTLALGTPALSMIGTFGAALTVGLRRGGLLLSLIVLPLYMPTLIFGAEAVRRGGEGLDALPPLLMLAGVTAGAIALLPFATAAALKVNLR